MAELSESHKSVHKDITKPKPPRRRPPGTHCPATKRRTRHFKERTQPRLSRRGNGGPQCRREVHQDHRQAEQLQPTETELPGAKDQPAAKEQQGYPEGKAVKGQLRTTMQEGNRSQNLPHSMFNRPADEVANIAVHGVQPEDQPRATVLEDRQSGNKAGLIAMKKYFLEENYFDKIQQRVWAQVREICGGSSVSKLDWEAIKQRRAVLFATKKGKERQKAKMTARPNKNQNNNATRFSAKTTNPKHEQQERIVKLRKKKPKEMQGGPDAAPHSKTNVHPVPVKQRRQWGAPVPAPMPSTAPLPTNQEPHGAYYNALEAALANSKLTL